MKTACSGNVWGPYQKRERPASKPSPVRQSKSGYGPSRSRVTTRSRPGTSLCTGTAPLHQSFTSQVNVPARSPIWVAQQRILLQALPHQPCVNFWTGHHTPCSVPCVSSASCFRWIVQTTWCVRVRVHKVTVQEGSEQRFLSTSAGAVGLTSNGVTNSPTQNGAAPAASQSVDPQLVSLLQKVASGGLQPETAARHLRELGAGYQQVMDFAQVCPHQR